MWNITYIVTTSKFKKKEEIQNLEVLHYIDNLNDL